MIGAWAQAPGTPGVGHVQSEQHTQELFLMIFFLKDKQTKEENIMEACFSTQETRFLPSEPSRHS